MSQTRRRFLGAAAVLTALAGCTGDDSSGDGNGGDSSGDGTGDDESTPTGDGSTSTDTDAGSDGDGSGGDDSDDADGGSGDGADEAATESSAATVRVSEHDELGEVLVDREGMTLYMFDADTQGEGASACYDDCASAWPPLTVEDEPTGGDGVAAELTTFEREDGTTQVAADGWPLYYFASDETPGDAVGQGVNDVWWVLDPDGTPVRSGADSAATPTETATESGTETATPTPTSTESDDDGGYY